MLVDVRWADVLSPAAALAELTCLHRGMLIVGRLSGSVQMPFTYVGAAESRCRVSHRYRFDLNDLLRGVSLPLAPQHDSTNFSDSEKSPKGAVRPWLVDSGTLLRADWSLVSAGWQPRRNPALAGRCDVCCYHHLLLSGPAELPWCTFPDF